MFTVSGTTKTNVSGIHTNTQHCVYKATNQKGKLRISQGRARHRSPAEAVRVYLRAAANGEASASKWAWKHRKQYHAWTEDRLDLTAKSSSLGHLCLRSSVASMQPPCLQSWEDTLTQGFKEALQHMLGRAVARRSTSYKTFAGGWSKKAEDGGTRGGTQQSYFGLQKEGSWHRRKAPWDIQPGHKRFIRQGRKRGGSL